ncbi:MAG: C69 family dipeptidase [Candidatus Heimdallarchaeota archaeon]|nr:C69 family dipeptidase [Candidatus Heimdallarchaeota archaeon]
MCDTFVAVGKATIDGSVILGKNSDRQPNEPQEVVRILGGTTTSDTVKCTYISIPQVKEVNTVLLSKPIWIWGAEMGMNDKGVAIGNEAVWTIFDKDNRKEALIGMDMLRLALERGDTAKQCLDIIIDLLTEYGQGGNCGFDHAEYYDNSFIIADPKEAFILETAGKYWIAEKVKTIRSISNTLTIEQEYDLIHPELLDYAISKGLCKSEKDFNFKQQFSDKFNITRIGAKGDVRRACTLEILSKESGKVTPRTAFSALRAHNEDEAGFNPRKSSMKSPCVHASSMLTPSQSTGSLVAHLTSDLQIAWITGTSGPCLSVFKPFTPQVEVPLKPLPRTYEEGYLWWEHEILHRKTLLNYTPYLELFKSDLRSIERSLYDAVYNEESTVKIDVETIADLSLNTVKEELAVYPQWIKRIVDSGISSPFSNFRYRQFWNKLNKKAKIH